MKDIVLVYIGLCIFAGSLMIYLGLARIDGAISSLRESIRGR